MRSYTFLLKHAALSLLLATFCGMAEDSPTGAASDSVLDREETVVIGNIPTTGKPVLPATESEFRFKLTLTGDIVTLRWADLEENERTRLQKIYGLEVRGNQRVFGDKITGVRYAMASGRTIEGFPIPDRNRPGLKAIRTATTPLMHLPERDIQSEEKFEAYESDFFSAREVYDRWILENPPGINDAAAHFNYAERCAKIGLYAKALEHLESACLIDPRMTERTQEFKTELVRADADTQVKEMLNRMITAKRGGDYFQAWDLLERLDRNFPGHDWRSQWESLRAEIEQGVNTNLSKRVIFLAYSLCMDMVQEKLYQKIRVDDKGNVVPSIPGKQVTTRKGHAFKGVILSGGEGGGDIVLKVGDTELTISGKEVVAVRDIDLSKAAREVPPTFDQLKEYVTNTGQDGLKSDMIKRISTLVKKPESQVKEVFENRLSRQARYIDGNYEADPVYVSLHDAQYGSGSWLRDGSRPGPIPQTQNNQPRNTRVRINGQNINIPNAQQQPDPNDDPNLTDDPEIWWGAQSNEVRLSTLRAMAAEKVFKVKQLDTLQCRNCRGQKNINVMGPSGTLEPYRCPVCRGMGVMFKINYW
jgi:hypothetical protein